MALPSLIHYNSIPEYRQHYETVYCRGNIQTFDGIRVYFSPGKFGHAFYESTGRDGRKDVFSPARAQRIDWIKATLENPDADQFQGWDYKLSQYDLARRVSVVYQNFVVIVALRPTRKDTLKGNFITCFQADNSIHRIRSSPRWTMADCLRHFGIQK